jgi:hypothetical protein
VYPSRAAKDPPSVYAHYWYPPLCVSGDVCAIWREKKEREREVDRFM